MISRRGFIAGVVIALTPLGATASAQEYKAQQPGKVYKVGILWFGRPPSLGIFRQSLADAGYVDGKNVSFLHRWPEAPARFPDLARELIRLKVDVLVASDSGAIRAIVDATTTIPVERIVVQGRRV